MNNSTYRFLVALVRRVIWQGWRRNTRLQGVENLQKDDPAVFLSNHANALGPIGCIAAFPVRLYPWIRPEMLDLRTNPDYMRADFIEKDLHLRPPLSLAVAWGLSRVVVPLLNSVGCIPVFQSDQIMEKHVTLEQSLGHLVNGENLLVFPEIPGSELDPETKMGRFSSGVLWLAALYSRKTGYPLPFYPVCVHPTHRIRLGQAIQLGEEDVTSRAQRQMWIETLERSIREMYLEMESRH